MAKTSFGRWLRRRRKALDLSQAELARRVNCAAVTIFKFEADQRRPSRQIAELLAQHLAISPTERTAFIEFARGARIAEGYSVSWDTPTNLPSPPTPLIGREADVAAVRKQLMRQATRLLTLVGPPGVGKTRLSLAVAESMLEEFADGVFFVPLAPVADPNLVPASIARAFAIQERGPQSSFERLKAYLSDKEMLLVMDNFEHLLAAAAQIAELLGVHQALKILTTSRAPLGIRHERQFPVPPLALPALNHTSEAKVLSSYASIELFVERAQAVKPDFELTRENGTVIAGICRRLDGLPLAIELLSARVKMLSPTALLGRLQGQLLLQSGGLLDLEPRHRTLNAAIRWSYDLLVAEEKTLFMHLGVFVGGFTLEAVEAICNLEVNSFDAITSLLDKSLIQQTSSHRAEPRFFMLETIREYALERLHESRNSREVRHRHSTFFLALAQTPDTAWLDRIEQDYENFHAALDWCLQHHLIRGVELTIALERISGRMD